MFKERVNAERAAHDDAVLEKLTPPNGALRAGRESGRMLTTVLAILRVWGAMFAVCALLAAPAVPTALDAQPLSTLPPIRHVFTIILENQSFDSTFGVAMPAPYLARIVAGHGALLQQYYGTSHYSLGN